MAEDHTNVETTANIGEPNFFRDLLTDEHHDEIL
jgi:hypothetical protein